MTLRDRRIDVAGEGSKQRGLLSVKIDSVERIEGCDVCRRLVCVSAKKKRIHGSDHMACVAGTRSKEVVCRLEEQERTRIRPVCWATEA